MISVVLPQTIRRPAWMLERAVQMFERQTWPDKELIIVDEPGSIGAARNIGAARAKGDLIAMMDDDDWYGPMWLERMAAKIDEDNADMVLMMHPTSLRLSDFTFWAGTAHHTSLLYRRQLHATFADCNYREERPFKLSAHMSGARLTGVPSEGVFIYVRHDCNTSPFPGPALTLRRVPEPDWFIDCDFYRALASGSDDHAKTYAFEPGLAVSKPTNWNYILRD